MELERAGALPDCRSRDRSPDAIAITCSKSANRRSLPSGRRRRASYGLEARRQAPRDRGRAPRAGTLDAGEAEVRERLENQAMPSARSAA
jgi:hypothetical protein